jgi:pimeloyl-ACP methyl ester carboxylesterase
MNNGKENILIIIERDNFKKDLQFIKELTKSLEGFGHRIIWYNPRGAGSSYLLDPKGKRALFPSLIRKVLKVFTLLKYPMYWKYYFTPHGFREKTIAGRCKNLTQFIKKLGEEKNISILSRSAGGRISSLIADKLGIEKLICLGYPFKHPNNPLEPERFLHLVNLKTPFLIIQGTKDPYVGTEISEMYQLSPYISLSFMDTDHEFKLTSSQQDSLIVAIRNFIFNS